MPTDPSDQEPATMQTMVTRIIAARPNTVIGGSVVGSGGGGLAVGESPAASSTEEPRAVE